MVTRRRIIVTVKHMYMAWRVLNTIKIKLWNGDGEYLLRGTN